MSHLPEHRAKNLVTRVNRIEGQVGGIRKMILEEKPYDEIIIQLNAAQSAIQKISQILLEAQTDHALMNVAEGASLKAEMEKMQRVLKQYNKMN